MPQVIVESSQKARMKLIRTTQMQGEDLVARVVIITRREYDIDEH